MNTYMHTHIQGNGEHLIKNQMLKILTITPVETGEYVFKKTSTKDNLSSKI